ncbi:lipase family protein [Rhodococcus pyridinivorans]
MAGREGLDARQCRGETVGFGPEQGDDDRPEPQHAASTGLTGHVAGHRTCVQTAGSVPPRHSARRKVQDAQTHRSIRLDRRGCTPRDHTDGGDRRVRYRLLHVPSGLRDGAARRRPAHRIVGRRRRPENPGRPRRGRHPLDVPSGLDPDDPIAFWGYSQGGMASASAAELAATYAPNCRWSAPWPVHRPPTWATSP